MYRQYLKKLNLPDKPGIYIFRDSRGRPLYIGRATSLRDRVKSYFSNDLITTRGSRIVDMVTKSTRLTHEITDSVLEAIILESNLIKRYQPKYNVDERDDKSDLYIVITKELWPRVYTVRARDWKSDGSRTFGPYPHAGLAIESLKILRKIFPFKDKKSADPRHDAFYRAIGRSPKDEDTFARQKYLRTIRNLILFLQGKKDLLTKRLEKEMKEHVKKLEFEYAGSIKRTLYALKHINDIALIKSTNKIDATGVNDVHGKNSHSTNFKIEAYDIAHLSGSNTVGAMVVMINGEKHPQDYRTFKMSQESNNDIANLSELVTRRLNHPEWSFPDLMVIDGGENQKKAIENVLSARRINIKVVSVVKDDKHKARAILGEDSELTSRWKKEIVYINVEAHRFVLAYHRRRRRQKMMI